MENTKSRPASRPLRKSIPTETGEVRDIISSRYRQEKVDKKKPSLHEEWIAMEIIGDRKSSLREHLATGVMFVNLNTGV